MSAVVDVLSAVGNYADSVYYGLRNSAGVFVGSTTTEPTAGNATGSSLARLVGVQDFPFEPPDPDMPSQPGDGGTLARFMNKPQELPATTAQFGASDITFAALAQSLVARDLAGGKGVLVGPYNPTYRDMILLAFSAAESMDSGNSGGMFECMLYFNVKCFPKLRNGWNTSSLPTYPINMVSNYATAFPWGESMTANADGDTKAYGYYFTWPYRPMLQVWKVDGSNADYTLSTTPAEDSANNFLVYLNGTALTYEAATAGTGEYSVDGVTLKIGSLGTSGQFLVALYGWA